LQAHSFFLSDIPFFFPEVSATFTSYCSDYPYLFDPDPVTFAIWLVSFDPITSNILHQTMAYASSVHNNLGCRWL
jgi:hypothetical protein